MLVFLDESGDAGFKFGEGSSTFFVVTLVIVPDPASAASLETTIAQLRHKLHTPPDYEFHFTATCAAWRESFMKEVNGLNFRYHPIVINKPALRGEGFKCKDSFYKFACRIVLENAAKELSDATVVLDGCGSREFQRELGSYLRRRLNPSDAAGLVIKKLKIQDSRRNNLLQLADMVCGAVARSFSGRKDAQLYRRWLKPREARVQFWPKENPGLSSEGTHTLR
ncbi:DUF3800 domain-containing protein [Opitutus terrae]|uniref:DUF3800 domain-containing protein n=1 Tax=Opitutus terrae (strain DSM 11246 / JCM 15787 / PB90-1) TaxID=452637 RepID=B1ZSG5_OPITP|nr:DUF3800 domain-containing protein [Opitutus terrae]ACB73822.1 hypothetical protein Oter_0532 [Opitutus terrae PB90-1]